MSYEKISHSLGVHDGIFHADEVTASALLVMFGLVHKDKILRTRDAQKLAKCEFVCDVGGIYDPSKKLFDHHQVDYTGDMSSAGMVLLYLKEQKILSLDEYHLFNHSLVLGVDAHDNGKVNMEIGVCTFSHVIANFNPVSYSSSGEETNACFKQALDFVMGHLERMKNRFDYNVSCRKVVDEAMHKFRTCLFFDQIIPWQENFFALDGKSHPALFVIMPAGEHWKLRGIPPDHEHRMQVRCPLPEKWAGLLEDQLKKVSGISGAVFCHKGRFTSVWETKEDAIMALRSVLTLYNIPHENNF